MRLPQPSARMAIPLLALTTVLLLLPVKGRADFPEAGVDAFDSDLTLILNVPSLMSGDISLDLQGPVAVTRGEPMGSNPCRIETRLISMSLEGFDPLLGDVKVTLNPELESLGQVVSNGTGCTFPATSFFDVLVQISVGNLAFDLINLVPVRVEGTIATLPPLFDTYLHPPPAISLVNVQDPMGPEIATIKGDSTHKPVQEPTLSVKANGPTLLDPAELHDFGNPPPVGLSLSGLGLVAMDDVDAASYGLDIIDTPNDQEGGEMSIAFSVDKDAVGKPNTGVNREATKLSGHEAEGDEFVSTFSGTNLELVDEQAVSLAPGNDVGDDLDALTNQPTSYADLDSDFDADRPVFFSLASGSPTLTSLGESPAAILYSRNGVVGVYATAAEIGLQPTDDLDALCLMKSALPSSVTVIPGLGPPGIPAPAGGSQFDFALFSLAKGSPTLTMLGASPGDLLATDFSSARVPGQLPAIYATADQIGLLADDELNALKCLMQVAIIPIYGVPTSSGTVLVNVGGNSAVAVPEGTYDSSAYGVWSIINPGIDFHGPYVHPSSPLALVLGMTQLDPTTVPFGAFPFDVCPLFHLHGGAFEMHGDPATGSCGHGVFVPHRGPVIPIIPGLEPLSIGFNILEALLSLQQQFPELYRSATLHRISLALLGVGFPQALQAAAVSPVAAAAPDDVYAIILTGTGRTKIEVTIDGADGLTVGPVLSQIPVPEPSTFVSGAVAMLTLAGIRRRRQ